MTAADLPAARRVSEPLRARGRFRPSTRLGRVACWLALAFVAWYVVNLGIVQLQQTRYALPTLPLIVLSWAGFATGALAGIVALVAIVRQRERAVAVFLTLLPLLIVLVFLVGELVVPH